MNSQMIMENTSFVPLDSVSNHPTFTGRRCDGETETRYYYHFDGLGSVAALLNVNGEVVERYEYDVFGEPNRVSDVNNPYLFTGRRYDADSGLYYYRARNYDPYIGRFLQTAAQPL